MTRAGVLGAVALALALAGLQAPAPAAAEAPTASVRTLPPVPGFVFSYKGQRYTTDASGTVRVPQKRLDESAQLQPVSRTVRLSGGREARFEKWYGQSKLTGSTGPATAAFSIWHPVRFRFTDLDGKDVARADLGSVSVKSSTGFVLELPRDDDTRQLQATRVVPDQDGLSVKELYYTVQTVDVEGNNVVNRSQTKLVPLTDSVVTVPLLFFDARVRARDALFGFGVSGRLVLEYPNGATRELSLGSGGTALPGLPRGQYHLAVEGPGLRIVQPVTMSRPQEVDLKVLTWLDIAALAVAGLSTAVGLVLWGRSLRRRARRPDPSRRGRHQRPTYTELPPPGLPLVLSGIRCHSGPLPRAVPGPEAERT